MNKTLLQKKNILTTIIISHNDKVYTTWNNGVKCFTSFIFIFKLSSNSLSSRHTVHSSIWANRCSTYSKRMSNSYVFIDTHSRQMHRIKYNHIPSPVIIWSHYGTVVFILHVEYNQRLSIVFLYWWSWISALQFAWYMLI